MNHLKWMCLFLLASAVGKDYLRPNKVKPSFPHYCWS